MRGAFAPSDAAGCAAHSVACGVDGTGALPPCSSNPSVPGAAGSVCTDTDTSIAAAASPAGS
eukprot:2918405-Prorocentrum_lima.AAC.1